MNGMKNNLKAVYKNLPCTSIKNATIIEKIERKMLSPKYGSLLGVGKRGTWESRTENW